MRVDNPLTEQADMGPLLFDERRQEVHKQVSEAIEGGAKLLRGGKIPEGPGFFYPPTVLLAPPTRCRLMLRETLGPVIPIVTVDSIERAILLSSDCNYALTASGWTTSEERAERLMTGLPAGVVTINDVLYSYGEPAATWSGYRLSGIGQNHGTPGLREMSRQRFVSFDNQPAESSVFAFPYDDEAKSVARTALDYLHGAGWLLRLRALARLFLLKRFRSRMPVRFLLLPKKHRGR